MEPKGSLSCRLSLSWARWIQSMTSSPIGLRFILSSPSSSSTSSSSSSCHLCLGLLSGLVSLGFSPETYMHVSSPSQMMVCLYKKCNTAKILSYLWHWGNLNSFILWCVQSNCNLWCNGICIEKVTQPTSPHTCGWLINFEEVTLGTGWKDFPASTLCGHQ